MLTPTGLIETPHISAGGVEHGGAALHVAERCWVSVGVHPPTEVKPYTAIAVTFFASDGAQDTILNLRLNESQAQELYARLGEALGKTPA